MPAARLYAGVMMLIPSTTMQAGTALDIQVTPGMLVFGGAGGRNNESRIQVDGLNTGAAFNGAGVSSYVPDISNAQEIATTTSGGMGEAEVGGPSFSIVPKTGGNTFKGSVYASNVTSGMVGDNYTDDLKQRGLTTPGALQKVWDYNVGLGGPIARDRAWFFAQARDEGSHRTVPGMFANKNFGDPTKWTYVADTEPSGGPGRELADWIGAPDRAAVDAQQVQPVLGRAAALPGGRPRWARRRMPAVRSGRSDLRRSGLFQSVVQRDRRAGNRHLSQPLRAARATGDVDVAGDEPVAARSRGRDVSQPLGRFEQPAISRGISCASRSSARPGATPMAASPT